MVQLINHAFLLLLSKKLRQFKMWFFENLKWNNGKFFGLSRKKRYN